MTVNCMLRSTLLLLFFVFFVCFAGRSFGQDLDKLSSEIQSGTSEQKRNALFEIRDLHTEPASRVAIPALSDPEPIVRATAAASIAFLPETETAVLLRPLLSDKDPFVRREAAYALRENRTGIDTNVLVKLMLDDKVTDVRSAAAVALGWGDSSAVDALTTILAKKPKGNDEFLRRSAAHSIGQVAEIARGGHRSTTTPKNFLPEKYKDSMTSNAATTSSPSFSKAVGVLLKVASNSKEAGDIRREAAFALGAIGDTSALAFLRANLTNRDNYLAEICKEALLKVPKTE